MAAVKKGAKCAKLKGAPRGWHLKQVYEHTDGSIYSFGQPVPSKSQAKRVAIQSKKKKVKKVTAKKKAKPKKVVPKEKEKPKEVVPKKKTKGYKLEVRKATCYRVELITPQDERVECSEWDLNKKEVEEHKGRILGRYGDADGAAILFDPKHPSRMKKKGRRGWVIVENDGTRHEYVGTSKVDAKNQFMRKFDITRMPRGTKIEKIK